MAIGQITREILDYCEHDAKEQIIINLSPYISEAKSRLAELINTENQFKSSVFSKMKAAQISSHDLYRSLSAFDDMIQLQDIYDKYQDAIVKGSETIVNIGTVLRGGTEYIYECGYFLTGLESANKSGILGEVRISAENMAKIQLSEQTKKSELFYLSVRQNKLGEFRGVRLTTQRTATPNALIQEILKFGGEELNVDQSIASRIFMNGAQRFKTMLGRRYEQYSTFKYHGYKSDLKTENTSWILRGDTFGRIKNKFYEIQNKFIRAGTQISTISSNSVKTALQTYINIYNTLTNATLQPEDNLNEEDLNKEIQNAVQNWVDKYFHI